MLNDKIIAELKSAMKSRDAVKLGVLRMVIAAFKNKEIELKHPLTDAEVVDVIRKEAKKRKESIAAFQAGNRANLAAAEQAELKILEPYLPKELSEKEVLSVVDEVYTKSSVREFGPLMKAAMAALQGRADAGMVARILKSRLES